MHCRESVIRCVGEHDVCQPSQRHAAVELLNLVLEELLQLWSLCLQCWRQEAILNREHLVMEVDVLHLEEEEKGFWKIPHFYTNEDKKNEAGGILLPTCSNEWRPLALPRRTKSSRIAFFKSCWHPLNIILYIITIFYKFIHKIQLPTRFLHMSLKVPTMPFFLAHSGITSGSGTIIPTKKDWKAQRNGDYFCLIMTSRVEQYTFVGLPAGCLHAHTAVPLAHSWCKCSQSSLGKCTRPAPIWKCASSCRWFSAYHSAKERCMNYTNGKEVQTAWCFSANSVCLQATICQYLRCEASR